MKLLSTICLAVCGLVFFCQEINNPFIVQIISIKHRKLPVDFKNNTSLLYQDSAFTASAFCMGEFGGHLSLQDRKTCTVYECAATCPLAIHLIKGRYIVTTTLAHGSGFSKIIEITNPHHLHTGPVVDKNGKISKFITPNNVAFEKGIRTLADTMDLLTIASFVRREQLYHIMTDFRKTYLAKNSSTKFIILDTIANFSTMTYDPKVINMRNNHSISPYKNDSNEGYLDIHDDSITIFRYH